MVRLPPAVVQSGGTAAGGGDAHVRVGLPSDRAVKLADILVLDLCACGQVNRHWKQQVMRVLYQFLYRVS